MFYLTHLNLVTLYTIPSLRNLMLQIFNPTEKFKCFHHMMVLHVFLTQRKFLTTHWQVNGQQRFQANDQHHYKSVPQQDGSKISNSFLLIQSSRVSLTKHLHDLVQFLSDTIRIKASKNLSFRGSLSQICLWKFLLITRQFLA